MKIIDITAKDIVFTDYFYDLSKASFENLEQEVIEGEALLRKCGSNVEEILEYLLYSNELLSRKVTQLETKLSQLENNK